MSARVDWFRIAVMIALAAAVIWVSIILGKSPLGLAFGQTVPPAEVRFPNGITLQDRETYSMSLGSSHQVCWSDPNVPPATNIQIWRYRVEGGPRTLYLDLARAGWVADGTGFCKTDIKIPKAGHWIYDAALCWGTNCSFVVTASCAAGVVGCAGGIGSVARGWWIYAFLPAPTGPVVN